MDRIYCSEQIEVPPPLPAILKAYTKEVIRYNPKDIPAFSRESVAHLDIQSELSDCTRSIDELRVIDGITIYQLLQCPTPTLTSRRLFSAACSRCCYSYLISYFAALAKGDVESFLEDQAKKKKAADTANVLQTAAGVGGGGQ